jgi:RHS repeat-associated protein
VEVKRGEKFFEWSNHLGNVLATVSDRKIAHSSNSSAIDYYTADVISAQDYYPFGMIMPGRTIVNGNGYRYGFNGKENDNEVKETGNQQDYGMRIYDPRIGKFLSVDPLTKDYPWNSSYAFAENNPIKYIDLDGLEKAKHWFDYDINDFMAWLGDNDNKPSKVIDRSVRSVNRNINPLGILTYNGYQIITGRDLDTKAPASRIDGLGNIVIAGIFHQSAVKLATPTATMQLEGQMASNAAAMNTVRRTASQEASANSIAKQQSSLVGRPAASTTRSLFDPLSLKGAKLEEVQALIPKDWIRSPLNKGEGVKFINPHKKGEQILLEEGWPKAKDPLHQGPYMKISRDGKITRIALEGNPILK